jgi:hypothetical protein
MQQGLWSHLLSHRKKGERHPLASRIAGAKARFVRAETVTGQERFRKLEQMAKKDNGRPSRKRETLDLDRMTRTRKGNETVIGV